MERSLARNHLVVMAAPGHSRFLGYLAAAVFAGIIVFLNLQLWRTAAKDAETARKQSDTALLTGLLIEYDQMRQAVQKLQEWKREHGDGFVEKFKEGLTDYDAAREMGHAMGFHDLRRSLDNIGGYMMVPDSFFCFLSGYEFAAVEVAYAAGLRPGDSRQDFINAGLIEP